MEHGKSLQKQLNKKFIGFVGFLCIATSTFGIEPLHVRAQLTPVSSTVLASEVAGKVAQFSLKEGNAFQKGETLVMIDCTLHQARLARAFAHSEETAKTYEAHTQLDKLGSITVLEKEISKARFSMAKADVHLAQAIVDRCVIKAPFSGRIIERKIRQYEYVSEGMPLVEILDDKHLEVEMILPSASSVWIKIGHPLSFYNEETATTFKGKVERIVPKVDPVSQSLKIYGSLEQNMALLYPGMSGTVTIAP